MLLVVLVPGALAFLFGYFAFRSRIKGVYFSIITQALTFAAMLLFFRNDTGFGGNNGFTDFKRILGYDITAPGTRAALYWCTLAALAGALVLARAVTQSAGPGADRRARQRKPAALHRLRAAGLQALRLDAVGRALRHRRRAVRAAGRHHQSRRDVHRELHRNGDLWPRADAAR